MTVERMKYLIIHTTRYRYSEPASLSQNELFLSPRDTAGQRVLDSTLDIEPEPQYFHQRTDYFGNNVIIFMVQHPHNELVVTARSTVESFPAIVPIAQTTGAWEEVVTRVKRHQAAEERHAYQFSFPSPLIEIDEAITEYGRLSFTPGRPVLEAALELTQRIYDDFTYDKNATDVDTSVSQVLQKKRGVCQDFAHFCISCLRGLGLAARYVSGYLETLPPPGKPKLIGVDASHAWLSLYIPDIGWVDLDPTNNLIPGHQHITLAWGRDYGDVTPVKGVVMGGGVHTLAVTVDMRTVT